MSRWQGRVDITPLPQPPDCWIETPPPPGQPDLIPGLLKSHGSFLITGEHEAGKTLIALELAHGLLTGGPLWGKVELPETVQHVTYILGEHDQATLHEQWNLAGLSVPEHRLRVIPPEERRLLVRRGEMLVGNRDLYRYWCRDSQLVIFDPLSAFISGVDVENDNIQMRTLINAMLGVCQCVLILHHMGKPSYDPREAKYVHRGKYASRGASGIEDAVVGCFYLEEKEKDLRYRLTRVKYKGQAPSFYMLKRAGLRHTMIGGGLTQAQLSLMQRQKIEKRWAAVKATKETTDTD